MPLIPGYRGQVAAMVVVLAATTGCASETMRPCAGEAGLPQGSVCPTQGTAHVVVTGFEERTFDAPLDTEASFRPSLSLSLGVIQLSYRDRSRLPTDSFSFGGARATADAQQVGANVLIHGSGYSTRSGCTITLSAFDTERIAGSFTCTAMAPFGLEDSTTRLIDATGSFSATP